MTKQIRAYIPDDAHQLLLDACTARDTSAGEVIGAALRGLLDPQRQTDQLHLLSEQVGNLVMLVGRVIQMLTEITAPDVAEQTRTPTNGPASDPLAYYTGRDPWDPGAPEEVLTPEPPEEPGSFKRGRAWRFFLKG